MGFEMSHVSLHMYRATDLMMWTSDAADTSIHIGRGHDLASYGSGFTEKLFVRANHMSLNAGEDFTLVTEVDPSLPGLTSINLGDQDVNDPYTQQVNVRAEVRVSLRLDWLFPPPAR